MSRHPVTAVCPRYHHAVELIGKRWNGAIVLILLSGSARFAGIAGSIPDISDRMLAGSVGKMFFGARAMQLVKEGKIALDDPLSKYLGSEIWWKGADGTVRLPNGADITLRMLMNHTSAMVMESSSGPAAAAPRPPKTSPATPNSSTKDASTTLPCCRRCSTERKPAVSVAPRSTA